MNEMRHDWLSDRWVIFAPNRTTRPDDYDRTSHIEPESHLRCPFCRGSESETPQASLTLPGTDWESTRAARRRGRSQPPTDWLVRVVPNKFPAVSPSASREDGSANNPIHDTGSLFVRQSTAGAHEVIIESPQHVTSITSLSHEHTQLVFEAYQQRLAFWRARPEIKYAVVFKNYGADAGATIVHSHSQLICTSFVPSDVLRIQKRLMAFRETNQNCYVCSILDQELHEGSRIVAQSSHFVALCPFASRFPYSVSVIPRHHRPHFDECAAEEIQDLSRIAQSVLKAVETEHPHCAYNFVLQTSPFDQESPDAFHWRLKIIPRLSKIAGFEWSSDCFINTVLPEVAAQALRQRIPGTASLPTSVPVAPIGTARHTR